MDNISKNAVGEIKTIFANCFKTMRICMEGMYIINNSIYVNITGPRKDHGYGFTMYQFADAEGVADNLTNTEMGKESHEYVKGFAAFCKEIRNRFFGVNCITLSGFVG